MTSGKTISGTKLHELREKRLLSAYELSVKSGLHGATILKIERSPASNCHFGTLRKLAEAFGMKPEEFLEAVAPNG